MPSPARPPSETEPLDSGRSRCPLGVVSDDLFISIRACYAVLRMRLARVHSFVWLLVAVTSVSAQPSLHKLSGIYSDLQYNAEAGDLNGMELLIVPQESGWRAFVQISEGGAPYIAIVPLTVKGNQIAFMLPPGGAYSGMPLVGTIIGTEILVRWSNGQIDHLRHGKSYWQ